MTEHLAYQKKDGRSIGQMPLFLLRGLCVLTTAALLCSCSSLTKGTKSNPSATPDALAGKKEPTTLRVSTEFNQPPLDPSAAKSSLTNEEVDDLNKILMESLTCTQDGNLVLEMQNKSQTDLIILSIDLIFYDGIYAPTSINMRADYSNTSEEFLLTKLQYTTIPIGIESILNSDWLNNLKKSKQIDVILRLKSRNTNYQLEWKKHPLINIQYLINLAEQPSPHFSLSQGR